MPCPYPKGSQEAKEYMAQLRARRGKGVCGGKRRISVRMKKGGAILPSILLGILSVKGAENLISKIRGGKVESAASIGKKFAEYVEKHPMLKNQGIRLDPGPLADEKPKKKWRNPWEGVDYEELKISDPEAYKKHLRDEWVKQHTLY